MNEARGEEKRVRQEERPRSRDRRRHAAAVDQEVRKWPNRNSPATRFSPSLSGGSIKSASPAAACCAGAETKVEKGERPEEDASKEFAMRLAAADANDDEEEEEEKVDAVSLSKVGDEAPSRKLKRSAWPVLRARRRSIRREERKWGSVEKREREVRKGK